MRVNPNHTAMGRFSKEPDCIVPIYKPAEGLWGIFPENAEQAATDANDDTGQYRQSRYLQTSLRLPRVCQRRSIWAM